MIKDSGADLLIFRSAASFPPDSEFNPIPQGPKNFLVNMGGGADSAHPL